MFEKRYRGRILAQKEIGLYRNPPQISKREGKYVICDGKKLLSFSSNDYLGLASNLELQQKVVNNFSRYGSSSSSSRLVAGNYSVIREAEKAFAEYFGYEDCLFYPSGYQANLGLISTLFEAGDLLIFDKHVHASSVKGMSLSGAELKGFKHNSMKHLEKRLISSQGSPTAVLTESLFSMDGNFLNVDRLKQLKEEYKFFTIVDEAHSVGVSGEKGRGIAGSVADAALGTFGKALALFGAFALVTSEVREYLINFSSPQIYTTSLPEAHGASALDLLKIIEESDDAREQLKTVSLEMKKQLTESGYTVMGDAHILALLIGDEEESVRVSKELFNRGILAFPARYPTVPYGKAILRFGMSALHDQENIKFLLDQLKEVFPV